MSDVPFPSHRVTPGRSGPSCGVGSHQEPSSQKDRSQGSRGQGHGPPSCVRTAGRGGQLQQARSRPGCGEAAPSTCVHPQSTRPRVTGGAGAVRGGGRKEARLQPPWTHAGRPGFRATSTSGLPQLPHQPSPGVSFLHLPPASPGPAHLPGPPHLLRSSAPPPRPRQTS